MVLNPALVSGNNNSPEACYNEMTWPCPPGSIYRNALTVDASEAIHTDCGGSGGSFACSRPMERYGRRLTLLYNCSLHIVGTF